MATFFYKLTTHLHFTVFAERFSNFTKVQLIEQFGMGITEINAVCGMRYGVWSMLCFYLSILYGYTIISHNRSVAEKKNPKTTTTDSNNFYRKTEITHIHTYQRRMIKENCHRTTKSNKFKTRHGQHAQSPFGWHSVARIFCFESSHTNSLYIFN